MKSGAGNDSKQLQGPDARGVQLTHPLAAPHKKILLVYLFVVTEMSRLCNARWENALQWWGLRTSQSHKAVIQFTN
jgi:hypothetical protein